jgi:hypothetical protein
MSRPKVATISPTHKPPDDLECVDKVMGSRSNITFAITAPPEAPTI